MDAEFLSGIQWTRWFLDPPGSLYSSTALEVAASEYKCQGLEIDLVGLCWSWDLIMHNGTWHMRRLDINRRKWQPVGGERERFIRNAYRVLLTRARYGLVIWVPEGSSSDRTRDPAEMDETADYLRSCGVRALEEADVVIRGTLSTA
jgi:hypothetical protein